MSTATAARGERLHVAFLFSAPKQAEHNAHYEQTQNPDGSLSVKNVPVFKSGTFKDSWGDSHTWEPMHLNQMVSNFDMLKSGNIFPNVPARDGHRGIFGSGGAVVGYHDGMSTTQAVDPSDGQNKTFLCADFTLTDPTAIQKWQNGTYRARSSEVGQYESNSAAMYWPVYMGFAFCDIPAVEGLFSQGASVPQFLHEETSVTPEEKAAADKAAADKAAADKAAADAAYAAKTAEEKAAFDKAVADKALFDKAVADKAAADKAVADAAAANREFSMNGQPTTDFAAVQAHITGLETFRNESLEQARKDFVTALGSNNKIAATQVESLTVHALSLDSKQWDSFKASWEAAPAAPLFGKHSSGITNPSGEVPPKTDERTVLEETIALHKRSGMSEENIKKTGSYQKLQALGPVQQ